MNVMNVMKKEKTLLIRIATLFLALLMIGTTLIACANDPKDPDDNPNTPNTPTNPDDTPPDDEEDPYAVADNLPDVSYNGAEFNILYYLDYQLGYFYVPEKTGDLIDDAVFSALSSTEERFDVQIGAMYSGADSEDSFATIVSTQIQSGATDFDLVNIHDVKGGNLSIQGFFLNILDMEQFDFSKPWWSEKAIDSLSFMGQLYLISSTMSYSSMGSTYVTFFNKDLMDARGMEYPYQDVLDNNWYLEDMIESVEDYYEDTNGNGKDTEDVFGVLMPKEFYAQFESYGISMIEKGEDGTTLTFNGNDPRAYDLVELYYNALYEYDCGYSDVRATVLNMFKNNQGIYLMSNLKCAVENFRDSTVKYGIVPYPMLDDQQESYYSGYNDRFMAIPNTCADTDYVATIVESMSAEGYRQVLPAYYETALKGRYTHDSESVQMLELIRASRVIDFAYVYSGSENAFCCRALSQLMGWKSKNYASYIKERTSAAEKRIDEVTSYFESMAY